jgi:hypothetical protein
MTIFVVRTILHPSLDASGLLWSLILPWMPQDSFALSCIPSWVLQDSFVPSCILPWMLQDSFVPSCILPWMPQGSLGVLVVTRVLFRLTIYESFSLYVVSEISLDKFILLESPGPRIAPD